MKSRKRENAPKILNYSQPKLGHTTKERKNASRRFSANISQSSPCSWQKIPDAFHDNFNRDYHIFATSHRLCTLLRLLPPALFIFLPRWTIFITLRATMNYTVVHGNSLVQWCIFVFVFFSLNKGEGLLIIVNDFTIKR